MCFGLMFSLLSGGVATSLSYPVRPAKEGKPDISNPVSSSLTSVGGVTELI